MSLELVLIMGLLTKSSEVLRLAPTGLAKSFWRSLSLWLHRIESSQLVRISSRLVRGSLQIVRIFSCSIRAYSDLIRGISLASVDQPFLYLLQKTHLHDTSSNWNSFKLRHGFWYIVSISVYLFRLYYFLFDL